jgi:hypothetical protein
MARKEKKNRKGEGASDGHPGKQSGNRQGPAASGGIKKAGVKASKPKKVKGESVSKKSRVKTAQDRRKVKAKLKAVYWAVQVGWCPGVYTSHDRYQDQVKGFSGAVSQKFSSKRLAEAFVGGSAGSTEQVCHVPSRPTFQSCHAACPRHCTVPRNIFVCTRLKFGKNACSLLPLTRLGKILQIQSIQPAPLTHATPPTSQLPNPDHSSDITTTSSGSQ